MTVVGHPVSGRRTGVRMWADGHFIGQAQAAMGLEEALERQSEDELLIIEPDNRLLKWTMDLVNGLGTARFKIQEDGKRLAFQVCAFPRKVQGSRVTFVITGIERDDWLEED